MLGWKWNRPGALEAFLCCAGLELFSSAKLRVSTLHKTSFQHFYDRLLCPSESLWQSCFLPTFLYFFVF